MTRCVAPPMPLRPRDLTLRPSSCVLERCRTLPAPLVAGVQTMARGPATERGPVFEVPRSVKQLAVLGLPAMPGRGALPAPLRGPPFPGRYARMAVDAKPCRPGAVFLAHIVAGVAHERPSHAG